MPVYEYKCDDCGKEFEIKQGMEDAPLTRCKDCSGPVHRLISFTSFSLKGSGWYSDGYGAGAAKKKNGKTSVPEVKAEVKPETKKEDTASSAACTTTTLGKTK